MKFQEIHTFGEVFNGKTPSTSEQQSSGLPILKIRDIDENGKFRDNFESFVDQHFYNKYSKKRLKTCDTIILNAAHNSDYVGSKNALITDELEGVIATGEWLIVRPKEANGIYVNHFLKSPLGRNALKTRVKGIHLYPKDVEKIKVPLPPIDDQVLIAHLLGKVEGLIAQRKENLQQLDDLLKSVFLEMFGDPISNPKGFPVKRLSEFYINPKDGTKCGPFGSALKKDELVDSGVSVWNMDNIDLSGRMILSFRMWITVDKYQELRSYSVIDGDIIISRAGTVGKMCVAKLNGVPAIISTNLIRLRLGPKLLPLYVVSLMTHCKGRVGRLKTGADGAFTHMNTGILDKLEFPYPPIELQKQYASIVEKVESIKSHYQHSLTELENLYDVLSQKAFKGELDLSRVPVNHVRKEMSRPKPTTDHGGGLR
jgi:restriction endonuclease S subunit